VSRPAAAPLLAGLAALHAAVVQCRLAEPLPSTGVWHTVGSAPGRGAGHVRAVVPSRPGGAGQAQAGTSGAVALPAPSAAADDGPADGVADRQTDDGRRDDGPPPAEGDSATALRLVERAQSGDADAFGELYDRYVDVVFRYVCCRVGSRQLAEDLTSETFLRALRRIGSFTWQGRDVGAWFVTIARNLVADHDKSSRYRQEVTTDDLTAYGTHLVDDGPEDAVIEVLRGEVLLSGVRRLGAEQQECVVLRFLQDLSVAETAAVMGRSEGAVKALQYRAVRTLARLLPEGMEQ
jgi:RNA polymerase sigma-70 factor, ECF subfamily